MSDSAFWFVFTLITLGFAALFLLDKVYYWTLQSRQRRDEAERDRRLLEEVRRHGHEDQT